MWKLVKAGATTGSAQNNDPSATGKKHRVKARSDVIQFCFGPSLLQKLIVVTGKNASENDWIS